MEILLKTIFILSFLCLLGAIGFVGVYLCVDENSSDDIYD